MPTGFDSMDLINQSDLRQLQQAMKQGEEPSYDEVVKKPERQKFQKVEQKLKFCQDWKS